MPTTFTTHIGTVFHGLDLTWTHDPASPANISVEMGLNYYSNVTQLKAANSSTTGPNCSGSAGNACVAFALEIAVVMSIPNASATGITCSHEGNVGQTVCYDGIKAHFDVTGVKGTSTTYNTCLVKYKPFATGSVVYDLAPGTPTDTTTTDTNSPDDEQWKPSDTTTDRCDELWYLDKYSASDEGGAVACVHVKAPFTRTWATTDLKGDIQFAY